MAGAGLHPIGVGPHQADGFVPLQVEFACGQLDRAAARLQLPCYVISANVRDFDLNLQRPIQVDRDVTWVGTYWYHPHERSFEQVGRGLYGPLIVEEREPIQVDRDVTWVLDDWRLLADAQISDDSREASSNGKSCLAPASSESAPPHSGRNKKCGDASTAATTARTPVGASEAVRVLS